MTTPTDPVDPGDDGGGPRAVHKALSVLLAFRAGGHTLGVTRLATMTNLPKSTVHRLAGQLVEAGFLVRSGSAYRIAPLVFEVGSTFIHAARTGLVPIAGPHLGALFLHTQGTVGLYVLTDGEPLLLDQVVSPRFPDQAMVVGTQGTRPGSAPGKAMAVFATTEADEIVAAIPAAERREIADGGVAVDTDVLVPGLITVASPILVGERSIAAVTVSAPVRRADLPMLRTAALRTARMIASDFITTRRELGDYSSASPFRDLLDEETP